MVSEFRCYNKYDRNAPCRDPHPRLSVSHQNIYSSQKIPQVYPNPPSLSTPPQAAITANKRARLQAEQQLRRKIEEESRGGMLEEMEEALRVVRESAAQAKPSARESLNRAFREP